MSTNTRFIKSVVASTTTKTPAMPWARGARRAAFAAKRNGIEILKKTA